jgi:hypothetical protein
LLDCFSYGERFTATISLHTADRYYYNNGPERLSYKRKKTHAALGIKAEKKTKQGEEREQRERERRAEQRGDTRQRNVKISTIRIMPHVK